MLIILAVLFLNFSVISSMNLPGDANHLVSWLYFTLLYFTLTGKLSLIYAWSMADMWLLCG